MWSRSWVFLRYDESAPYGLVAEGPENLRDRALLRSIPGRSADEVEDAVHAYQHRHDLAAGLRGMWLPSVWLVREGHLMRVRAGGKDIWVPLADALDILATFATQVLERAARFGSERQRHVKHLWEGREHADSRLL